MSWKMSGASAVGKYRISVAFLMFFAFLVRAIHVSTLTYSPFWDMSSYWAGTDIFLNPSRSAPELELTLVAQPFYYWFFGASRMLFGTMSYHPALYMQAFIDALSCGLVIFSARVLYGARAGLISGFLYAVYRICVLNTGLIMTETWAAFAVLLSIAAFLLYTRKPSVYRVILAGISVGFAVHVRANLGTILGTFAVYTVICGVRRLPIRIIAVHVLLIIVATFGTMTPWTIRNSLIAKKFVPFIANVGGNALTGMNPVSYGKAAPLTAMPQSWQEEWKGLNAVEQNAVMAKQLKRFIEDTHRDFVWFTLIPIKVKELLTDTNQDPWTQHGKGAPVDVPLGPRVRIPFLDWALMAAFGFSGLLIGARRRLGGFTAMLWVSLFLPILLVPAVARYRLPSELPMIISCGAIVERLFFLGNFEKRWRLFLAGYASVSILWTILAMLRFSGPNVLNWIPNVPENRRLKQMVDSTFKYTKPIERTKKIDNLKLGSFTVFPGRCSHLWFNFKYRLTRLPELKNVNSAWSEGWPRIHTYCIYFDDRGTTVPWSTHATESLQYAQLGNFQDEWSSHWRLVTLPAQATSVTLGLQVLNAGTVEISNLSARGPVWLRKEDLDRLR